MLWVMFTLLFVLWLLSYGFQMAGSVSHVLLAAALLALVLSLIRSEAGVHARR
jgi:Family of unknown function (DUF5670)